MTQQQANRYVIPQNVYTMDHKKVSPTILIAFQVGPTCFLRYTLKYKYVADKYVLEPLEW